MSRSPDRALLSRLVDAYDRIAGESLGMGDPEFHAIEERLFDAIAENKVVVFVRDDETRRLVSMLFDYE